MMFIIHKIAIFLYTAKDLKRERIKYSVGTLS
jgi:hypothetical protein